MASPPFLVEDQTDEDFFEKLVNDGAGSDPGCSENVESSDVQGFPKLGLDKVGTSEDGLCSVKSGERGHGEMGDEGNHALCKFDGNLENLGGDDRGVTESSGSVASPSVDESMDHVGNAQGVNAGPGVRQVQWSAFNSDSYFNGGTGDLDFFNEIEGKSGDPFGELAESQLVGVGNKTSISSHQEETSSSCSFVQHEESQKHGETEHASDAQGLNDGQYATETEDTSNSQYWENLYPGWKYDPNTGQWYQVDVPDATANTGENYDSNATTREGVSPGQQSDIYYLQQTAQSVTGRVTGGDMSSSVSYWNQNPQGSTEYPAHMVFDPQYPGWYYDLIAQEWKSLDSYTASPNQLLQSQSMDNCQQKSNGSVTMGNYLLGQDHQTYVSGQVDSPSQHAYHGVSWGSSGNNCRQHDMIMGQSAAHARTQTVNVFEHTQPRNGYISGGRVDDSADHSAGVTPANTAALYERNGGFEGSNGITTFQSFTPVFNSFQNFNPAGDPMQHHNHHGMELNQQMQFSPASFQSPKVLNVSQQLLQSGRQLPHTPSEQRSSAGRPPHALVAFGFGGKLIVMKDHNSSLPDSAYGSQGSAGGVINVLNMVEVVTPKNDDSDIGSRVGDYFHTLCQQSFPGPLVSGNVGSKELNKWIDDNLAKSAASGVDCRKGGASRMLFSLLKIACQYYGRLRSPFGTDLGLKESDSPESALAKLFASVERNGMQYSEYGAFTHCLQNVPTEEQIQVTALEVQKLLVSGRRIEALQCAQEGQLWGLAIVIAAQLGDQFYGDTVKQMALHQIVAGSPLRTLCLLLAGQPAEVFSNSTSCYNQPFVTDMSRPSQISATCMLDKWEENLAIITANRTKGDELVITHLGDCLWKDWGEVTAAHICYLVAEANIEPYSDSARLCLVGADHWKSPRTYASPEAIQRTELYEYAKVLGNSQFILLPFQPYKLIYACMLAEVGKMTDSLKYCQSLLKSLKAGRSPEVDAWRHMVSSLEERIKINQQGGYVANLAPTKLVGKLLNFFDSTAHRVVGGLPPVAPSAMHSNGQHNEHDQKSRGPRVSTSQSTMAMSSLIPSESVQDNNHRPLYNRSISEPDIGRTPRKVESPDKSMSPGPQNMSGSGGSSRFGRFGSQLFQKTVGLVLRSRSDRQAKLGERNRFYYDEKLKRWVEEGAEPPAEEAALPPPPTTTAFLNDKLDTDMKIPSMNGSLLANCEPALKTPMLVEKNSGIPPMPPSSNQFSARGRVGVRARYVDTFNKGGGAPTNVIQSPLLPATKPPTVNAKFFIPTPISTGEEVEQRAQTSRDPRNDDGDAPPSEMTNSFSPPEMPSSTTMHRNRSMGNMGNLPFNHVRNDNSPHLAHSRRTLSWSGALGAPMDHKPPGEVALRYHPSTYMPGKSSPMQFQANGHNPGDELQEVDL